MCGCLPLLPTFQHAATLCGLGPGSVPNQIVSELWGCLQRGCSTCNIFCHLCTDISGGWPFISFHEGPWTSVHPRMQLNLLISTEFNRHRCLQLQVIQIERFTIWIQHWGATLDDEHWVGLLEMSVSGLGIFNLWVWHGQHAPGSCRARVSLNAM